MSSRRPIGMSWGTENDHLHLIHIPLEPWPPDMIDGDDQVSKWFSPPMDSRESYGTLPDKTRSANHRKRFSFSLWTNSSKLTWRWSLRLYKSFWSGLGPPCWIIPRQVLHCCMIPAMKTDPGAAVLGFPETAYSAAYQVGAQNWNLLELMMML